MSGHFDGENTFYIGEFDKEMEDNITLALPVVAARQAEKVDGKIDLFINSYGGNGDLLQHMVEVVEIAKAHGVLVRTIITSAAYSAGSMLAVAGSPGERYISKQAHHLVHYGRIGGEASTPVQQSRTSQFNAAWFKQAVAHYERYAEIPNLAEHIADDGFYIPANKCIKWKLADKYTDKFQLGA